MLHGVKPSEEIDRSNEVRNRAVLQWWAAAPRARGRELFVAVLGSDRLPGAPALPHQSLAAVAEAVLRLAGERRRSRLGLMMLNSPDGAAVRVALMAILGWERAGWAARLPGENAHVVLLPGGEAVLDSARPSA